MRAFVTGSTGLLGNNLVKLLRQEHVEVRALARSEKKADRLLGNYGAKIVVGDMTNVDAFAEQLKGCDVLFHTAAYFREAFESDEDHWPMLERINMTNTIRLFDHAKRYGVKKIVHVSTIAALKKRADGQPCDETDLLSPEDALTPYARSKIIADERIAGKGYPIVTVMPSWMFGPGDAAPTGSGKFVINFLNRKMGGVFDSGIDIVDARDVAGGMLAAALRGRNGERYILSGRHASLAEICAALEQVSGIPAPRRKVPLSIIYGIAWMSEKLASITKKEAGMTMDTVRVMTEKKRTNAQKSRIELGVTYRPLAETLKDTVHWFRENA